MKSRNITTVTSALLVLAVAGCGDSTGVDGPGAVSLNFRVATSGAPASQAPRYGTPASATSGAADVGESARVAGPPLVFQGTNGTLTIDEIRVIVAEVELKGDDDSCEHDPQVDDDCADFEAPPRFLDLPLDGEPIDAFVGQVAPGTYKELEFEIEDLEDDESDTQFAAEIAQLRTEILADFPDWPRKASALVVGTFESSTGSTAFRVYLDAEIEVELDLIPNLVVTDAGEGRTELVVDIRPDIWFTRADGSVLPLHLYDWETTGELLEFEIEMEDGFTQIEIGR